MLKKSFAAVLLLTCCLAVFGQVKPRLGILPFTGGTGRDGETITTLLSFQSDVLGSYNVVPMTNAATAMVMDQNYQMSGFPDSDTLARIGRMLNADYVVSGYIRYLGDRNLVLTNVIKVETFELLAGYYQEYRRMDEIPALLPNMAKAIINAPRRNTLGLPKLAVSPFNVAKGVSVPEVETLAQVLITEINNSGRFTVLPRTSSIQLAKRDLDFQTQGYYTAADGARALGWAVNAKYVLNTEIYSVGAAKMFAASIINTENGSVAAESSRLYRTLSDGIPVMKELALLLSDGSPAAPPPQIAIPIPAPAPAPQPVPAPAPQPVPVPQPAPQPAPVPAPQPAPTPQPAPAPLPPPVPQPIPAPQPAEPIRVQPPEPVEPIHVQPPEPEKPEKPEREKSKIFEDPRRLWTVGVSAGTAFTVPWVIATVHGTIAPLPYTFIELGCDVGFISASKKVDSYYSIYPYGHLAFFMPFKSDPPVKKGGWYIGAGAGYLFTYYKFTNGANIRKNMLAADLTAGVNLFNFLDISYTLRAAPWEDLKSMSHKVSIGYTYRF